MVVGEPLVQGASDGWHRIPIDPSVLRAGSNTFDFSTTGAGYVYMSLDSSASRGHSFSSIDAGKTFTSDTTRPGDMRDREWRHAEYMVRLRVTRKRR